MIDDAPLVQRLELELAVLVLLVLVHRAQRPDPVAPDALDLAQPVPAERSDLAREAHLRHLPELVQLRAFVDLLAFLVLAVGVFGRVGKRRHVAAILIVLPCKCAWGEEESWSGLKIRKFTVPATGLGL